LRPAGRDGDRHRLRRTARLQRDRERRLQQSNGLLGVAEQEAQTAEVVQEPSHVEAVFLVFSLTDQASFDCLLPRWKQLHEEYEKRYRQNMDEPITAGDFAPDRIVILIGNKLDEVEKNPDKRKVTTEQGQNLAVALGAKHYYERSALYDTDMGHLRMPLDIALRYVVEKRQKQAASWSRDLVNQNKGKPTNPLIQLAWHDNTEDKASLNKREEVYGIHSLGAQQQQQQQKACCHS